MEAKIQYFQSPVFGQIRVMVIDDKPMFVAKDVGCWDIMNLIKLYQGIVRGV